MRVNIAASRRKSMKLVVKDNGDVELRIPLDSAKCDVLAFVGSHQVWLKERREQVHGRQQKYMKAFPILGELLPVTMSGEFLVSKRDIQIPDHWQYEDLRQAMVSWIRPKARLYFQQLIDQWWPHFQHYAECKPVLRVKRMRTRWGSLSQRGYINLNLSLMQLPADLIELVVVHELCHLKHFDHSPEFKELLASHLPDCKNREVLLQQQSIALML